MQAQVSAAELIEIIEAQETSALGHSPPIPMKSLIEARTASGGELILMDDQSKKSTQRQEHMRGQVAACRSKVNLAGRGVLVLVGSDHLRTVQEKRTKWQVLQEIVYSGVSFS